MPDRITAECYRADQKSTETEEACFREDFCHLAREPIRDGHAAAASRDTDQPPPLADVALYFPMASRDLFVSSGPTQRRFSPSSVGHSKYKYLRPLTGTDRNRQSDEQSARIEHRISVSRVPRMQYDIKVDLLHGLHIIRNLQKPCNAIAALTKRNASLGNVSDWSMTTTFQSRPRRCIRHFVSFDSRMPLAQTNPDLRNPA